MINMNQGIVNTLKMIADSHQAVVIYGAGFAGQIVHDLLKKYGANIASFVVSRMNGSYDLDGVRVYLIDEWIKKAGQIDFCYIVACIDDKGRKEIKGRLLKLGIVPQLCICYNDLFVLRKEMQEIRATEFDDKVKKKGNTIGYLSPGYLGTNYAEDRLIVNRIPGYEYVEVPNEWGLFPDFVEYDKSAVDTYESILYASYDPSIELKAVDIIHVFNSVCITDKPWIASFETILPRCWTRTDYEEKLYKELAVEICKPACKGIFAISASAFRIHESNCRNRLSHSMADMVLKKSHVLHPPQEVLISPEDFEKKHQSDELSFIFVGHFFFCKGGLEMLYAMKELREQYRFKLIIVSSITPGDQFTRTTDKESIEVKSVIKSSQWISYHEQLPHCQVLKLCKEANVGVFASYADTYGYCVLEFQASGCPVITTNIRALSEINNEECGWVCPLPVDEYGVCRQEYRDIRHELYERLKETVKMILEHPEQVRVKGKKAIGRIRKDHDITRYGETLGNVILNAGGN